MLCATPLELFYSGMLQEAVTAATDEVRQRPTDGQARGFLCELLCFAGELERADRQLEALAHQDASSAVGIALFRQVIRAEQARQHLYTEGRLPELLGPPCPRLRLHLEALLLLKEGRTAEAAVLLTRAEQQRPALTGTCDGRPFEGLRDLDDMTASFFEVLTSNGKHYWIPMESVELVEFRRYRRPRDLLWR